MIRPGATGERLLALFLLGVLLFSPPMLQIFSVETYFVGVPVLYVYLFVAWAVLIFIAASLAGDRSRAHTADTEPVTDGQGDRPADAPGDG